MTNKCPYCGHQMTGHRKPTREHILPTSRGGTNSPPNVIIVCNPCNNLKGNLTLREFYAVLVRVKDARAEHVAKLLGNQEDIDRLSADANVIDADELNRKAHERRIKRMAEIDALNPDVREVVHEHGWTIVHAFLNCGVASARQMQHLIRVIREDGGCYGNATTSRSIGFTVRNGERVSQ